MLCELPTENEDISPVWGSVCSGFLVSSMMERLSTLLISRMKIFLFVSFCSDPVDISQGFFKSQH